MRAYMVHSHPDGFRAGVRRFYEQLIQNANAVYSILEDMTQLERHMSSMEQLYKGYLACFVEDYPTFKDQYSLQQNKRDCIAMHLFVELSRVHFLLTYDRLVKEKRMILQNVEVAERHDTLVSFSLAKCRSQFWRSCDDDVPAIMTLGQEEIIDLLLYVTRRIEEMPYTYETLEDLNMLTLALFTRNSTFMCEACSATALNMPSMRLEVTEGLYIPNRDYMMLCSIYFNAAQRRLYYWNMLSSNIAHIQRDWFDATRTEYWVQHEVLPSLGEEGFEDLYTDACQQCFQFVGDEEWFSYRYPERPKAQGAILDCIRPEEAQEFYKGIRLSKEVVLETSRGHRDDITGRISRTCILLAVDQYLKNNYEVSWLDAVVVLNADIESSELKLCKSPFPCLIQVLGDLWVYNKGIIYPSNNIYETITLWVYLIQKQYDSVFGKTNLSLLVSELFTRQRKRKHSETEIVLPQI